MTTLVKLSLTKAKLSTSHLRINVSHLKLCWLIFVNLALHSELEKSKNFEEVRNVHKQLDKLKRQSHEELISIRRERDDLGVKTNKLEKELFRLKKNLRAATKEVSQSRELRSSSCGKSYEEVKQDLQNARNTERRLKEDLDAKDSQFEEERRHMRDVVKREKVKLHKYQEDQ
jgi:hypothetical protein